ncbi:hypothetical protein AU467_30055 [Mesorhizobium loti]|uniref:Uncharacterized protein n=1 Tax=Rhizobium loti TaxID=381 RepID=A0A124GFR3_RHILI|nr:hypothetical protein AU467_30055 [Mesorhizobium loti]
MLAAILGLDQAGVDRGGKARIVQLDGEIFALRFASGFLPGRTEFVVPARMRKSGPRSLSPSVATNLALTLRVRVLTEPVKPEPFSFLVKLPMVAIAVFLLFLGPRLSRPRRGSWDRRRSTRTRRAGTQWKAGGGGFFASRCKAAGGGKKLATDVAGRRSRRSRSSVRPNPFEDAVGVASRTIRERYSVMAIVSHRQVRN